VTRESASKSSPGDREAGGARHIATRCSVWLVEPPVAISRPARSRCFSRPPRPTSACRRWRPGRSPPPASAPRRSARPGAAFGCTNAAPGRCRPIIFHDHLVGVGGAVEVQCRAVVAFISTSRSASIQLALRIEAADTRLLDVGDAGGHRPPGRRSPAGGRRGPPDEEARHDLVADASISAPSKASWVSATAVDMAITSRLKEGQLHAGPLLGDAVAHGGHPTGVLRRRADLAGGGLDDRREALER